MLSFNELRYSYDFEYLIIDVSSDDDIIDSIIIDNLNTYTPSGPSDRAIFNKSFTSEIEPTLNIYTTSELEVLTEDGENCLVYDNSNLKHIRIRLKIGLDIEVDPELDILFVYVSGESGDSLIIETLINLQKLYKDILCNIKELNNKCSIPDNLITSVLKLQALETCIKTGNYLTLINLWDEYQFCGNNTCNLQYLNNCGCNGNS